MMRHIYIFLAVGKGIGHILPPFAFVAVTLDFPVSLSVASLAEAHMQDM